MELRQLRYFVRIVETGSMGSTMLGPNIGVSTLSQQMLCLENELAIRLPQYTLRGMTPTSAGLAFYSQTQLALRHADGVILAARESRFSGYVSVGMAPSTASVLGMPFINAMQGSRSDVRLHVVGNLSNSLKRMINTRQVGPTVMFQKKEILRWSAMPTLEEWLSLIGTHTLLVDIAGDSATPAQLASIPLIMSSLGHDLHGRLEVIYQEHALNIGIAMEIDGLAPFMHAVCSGIGVTLQPDAAISHFDKKALRVIGVHNPILSRPSLLVSLSDDELTLVGLVACVVLMKVIYQLVEVGGWSGAILYNNQSTVQHYVVALAQAAHIHFNYRFNKWLNGNGVHDG